MSHPIPKQEPALEQTVRVDRHDFRVLSRGERKLFWDRVSAGHWEPQTFRVFRRFLTPHTTCVDIGAWVGPTVLYAAHLAERVHAIEPDPIAFAELTVNVAANPALHDRVALHNQCISRRTGAITLYAGGMYHAADSRFGDSMSGTVPAPGSADQPRHSVPGITLEEFMVTNAISDCGLIKMDVEGGEYDLIAGRWHHLAAHGMPTLCVSFHAPAPAWREPLIGACLDELRACYRWIYSAAELTELTPDQFPPDGIDWGDEMPGSAWRELERILGGGLVASNEAW